MQTPMNFRFKHDANNLLLGYQKLQFSEMARNLEVQTCKLHLIQDTQLMQESFGAIFYLIVYQNHNILKKT